MKTLRQFLNNIDFTLIILLVFLSLFRDHLSLPTWLQVTGRMHPLVLHFPVVLIVAIWPVYFFLHRKGTPKEVHESLEILLLFAVLFCALSALSGLFLSVEGGYDAAILRQHRMTGITTTIFGYILLLVYTRAHFSRTSFHIAASITLLSLFAGSHYGSILTHGEGFITAPLTRDQPAQKIKVTDSSAVFTAVVDPILASKCYSCHNAQRAKGGFVMTEQTRFLKGGKSGPAWVSGDPDKSLMIQRLLLGTDDRKHMPPVDRPQLSPEELSLLHDWVLSGASLSRRFRDYAVTDSFRGEAMAWAKQHQIAGKDSVTYDFKEADATIVSKLNGPTRNIQPIAIHSPALSVQFFIRQLYQPKMLEELEPIRMQVVYLNLSAMPVKDEELTRISTFPNLEKLLLNGSDITGKTLGVLKSCTKLRSISLSSSKITTTSLEVLTGFPSLNEVVAWNTSASALEITALEKKNPGIRWYSGYVPDESEHLQLTPPMAAGDVSVLAPGQTFGLRHPMPGVTIRYTLDGSTPDSAHSTEYKSPIPINELTTIKALAVREGWNASGITTITLYTAGIPPQSASLLSLPESKYLANKEASLTDGLKGDVNNLAINWLGFRERPLVAAFTFDGTKMFKEVILSSQVNTGAYLFPPATIEVKGGSDPDHLTTIGKLIPVQPTKQEDTRMVPWRIPLKPGSYQYIEVRATPLPNLPQWHPGKKEKGWFFIDEAFFN